MVESGSRKISVASPVNRLRTRAVETRARPAMLLAAAVILCSMTPVRADSLSAACRLTERTQEYHRLIRKGSIRGLEKLRSADTPKMTKEEVRYLKDLARRLEDYQVRVLGITLSGRQAAVRHQVLGRYRKGEGEWNLNQEATWFWVYEEGDWYRLPLKPADWDEAKTVALHLPPAGRCP